MDIAVVIKCSDDDRLFRCIKSVPKDVEIVCSITPNKLIEQKLKHLHIPYCITPKGNLSITTNSGISLTKSNNVIIMDSDCYFSEGAVEALYKALKENIIAKGNIVFIEGDKFFGPTIAKLRSHVNNYPVSYTPGLAINKDIKNKVDYFFNEEIPWAEDAELNYRLEEAGIKLKIVSGAKIYHSPISLTHDLRSAFRIGCGKRKIVEAFSKYNHEDVINTIKSLFKGETFKKWSYLIRDKGWLVFCYSLLWDLFYYSGYYFIRLNKFLHRIIDHVFLTPGSG